MNKGKSIFLAVLILLGLFAVSRVIFRNPGEPTDRAIDFWLILIFPVIGVISLPLNSHYFIRGRHHGSG